MHYVILDVILDAFNERNQEKREHATILFQKRIENDVQDDRMRYANDLKCRLTFSDIYSTGPKSV